MKGRSRLGFTLVELVVAMAILVVLLTVLIGGVASFLRVTNAQEQEMLLEQNFRFAIDTFTNEARQATNITVPGGASGNLYLDESISLEVPIDGTVTTVTYGTVQHGSNYVLVRTAGGVTQNITEEIPQLIKAYFVKSGKKVFVVLVGRLSYGGRIRQVSLSSLVYARNLGG